MAVLKYKNGEGQFVNLVNYAVQPITPVQTTGNSLSDIMSQKAVSDEVNNKVNTSTFNEFSSATNSALANKADTSAVTNSITQATSGKVDTTTYEIYTAATNSALANKADTSAVTGTVDSIVDTKLEAYTTTNDADTRYAFKVHEHEVSAISGFDDAVAEAIATSSVVIDAVNSAITSAITSDAAVQNAIDAAVANKLEVSAFSEYSAATNSALANKADTSAVTNSITQATSGKVDSNTYEIYTAATNNVLNDKADLIHEHSSSDITLMSGYTKASTAASVESGDTLNVAIGKLEKKIDDAVLGGVSSVSLGSGSSNGTLALTVNGELQNEVAVPGVALTSDTYLSSAITDFDTAVESVVTSSTTIDTWAKGIISNEITSGVSGTIETIIINSVSGNATVSGEVKSIAESVIESNSAVTESKAFADFCSGHTSTNTLSNIPTNKRLVIAALSSSSNVLSLSGNSLTDGYEIHIIVENKSGSDITVTLPSGGVYVGVGDAISIGAGATGEINIISDGTKLYVRGV